MYINYSSNNDDDYDDDDDNNNNNNLEPSNLQWIVAFMLYEFCEKSLLIMSGRMSVASFDMPEASLSLNF